jgi:ATP phosphoribosyltransferase regulatory subunit
VYRLLRLYGLADAVLLDLGEVRGFDYYSGVHFEAYVTGLGASIAGGGRYDQMLGRFGYDCPATGFAFEIGRALLAMESQGVEVDFRGPDFFIIDFTPEKTVALSLSRRLRDLGASVARDIISRGLAESIAYARQQRARRVLVVGEAGLAPGRLRLLELAEGTEHELSIEVALAAPERLLHA